MHTRASAIFTILVAATTSVADAGEPIDIGGKKAVSVLAAVNAETQFASATLVGSADFSYITRNARFELGAGIRAVGVLAGPAVLAAYVPFVSGRINSGFFGPEENMLFYGGLNLGATIFTVDAGEDDTSAVRFGGGPKFGFEYYFSPRVALRVDNTITISEGVEDTPIALSDTFSIGARVLF